MLDTDQSKTDDELDAWLNSIQTEEPPKAKIEEPILKGSMGEVSKTERKEMNLIKEYVQKIKSSKPLNNFSMLALQGFERGKKEEISEKTQELLAFSLLPEHYQTLSGGFYFRVQNKGFVVNPGHNFLEKLHEKGLDINSIDFVIVSSNQPESFSEAKAIYDLNYKCNLQSDTHHIINYYLHQGAYKNLFAMLKPHFKQEKDTVKCLELYMDSPEAESIQLTDSVILSYFLMGKDRENLGISFQIKDLNANRDFSIAWLWLNHLTSKDISTLSSFDTIVGYLNDACYDEIQLENIKELLEKNPQKNTVLLFADLAKKDEDRRLKTTKKIKDSLSAKSRLSKTVLPLESGLLMNLQNHTLQCSSCQEFVNASDVHVAKSKKTFGKLYYLCSECCL
jgi:hypothetical protein